MNEITADVPPQSGEGLDAKIRRFATPVAIGSVAAYAAWSVFWATQGEKPGACGSLLVLVILISMGLKLAAETYLFSFLGGDPSPSQALAQRLVGPLARRTTARFLLGAFGGVIFPLAAQLLAVGAKHIPPVENPMPTAIASCLAALCLVPGEMIARRLYRREAIADSTHEAA